MTQPQYDPQAQGTPQGVPSQGYGQPAPYGAPGAPMSNDPLVQPLYGATFGQAIQRFFKKYAQFNGRASRSEYLWMALLGAIYGAVIGIVVSVVSGAMVAEVNAGGTGAGAAGGVIAVSVIAGLISLAVLVPTLALTVRRLHDGGFTGWLVLLNFVGLGIVTFIMCCLPTSPNGDQYNV